MNNSLESSLNDLVRSKENDRQLHKMEKEMIEKRSAISKVIFLICANIINFIGMGIAILGTVFGWRYLALVRGREKKPALPAGYFAALAHPLSTLVSGLGLLANYIFQQGDWGAQQNFVVTVASAFGVIFGIALSGCVIYLTVRWVSGNRKPGTLRG